MIFAYEPKAYQRWRTAQLRAAAGAMAGEDGAGLAGESLERVLMAMLVTNPDIVRIRYTDG